MTIADLGAYYGSLGPGAAPPITFSQVSALVSGPSTVSLSGVVVGHRLALIKGGPLSATPPATTVGTTTAWASDSANFNAPNSFGCAIYTATVLTTSSGTVTVGTTGAGDLVLLAEFAHVAAFDQANGNQNTSNVSPFTTGSVTPLQPNELFIAAVAVNGLRSTISSGPGGSWTNFNAAGSNLMGSYLILSGGSTAAQNATFTPSITDKYSAVIASYHN